MPNEIKNALKASTSHVTTNHTMLRQLPVAGSSTVSVMVWTISGIVLASCGGGGGGGAGGSGLSVSGSGSNGAGGGGGSNANGPRDDIARVVDGPVEGAAVYFDIDGDGRISPDERAEQTQDGLPIYITDANGFVNAPIEFKDRFFIANVDGAIDTATGDTLSGEYQSLSTGEIATPITDLVADRMRESNADAQGVLDDIFGTDGLVTVDDIRDAGNYKIQEYDVQKPRLPSDPTDAEQEQYDRDIAEYKTSVITKASLALSEIDKDDGAFRDLDRVNVLSQTLDDDPNNDVLDLGDRIDARVDAGREILGRSKPLAQPDSSVSPIDEDSVFRFPQGSEDIFGFDDPNGNSDDAAASRFTGIYVKSSVDFSQDGDAHTVNLLYNGSPLSRHEGAGSDSIPGNLPPEAGFYYVSSENLSRLSISPSPDDSGTLELEYYVFDGEQWSDKASLEITVSPVDDPPTAVSVMQQGRVTDIDENTDLTGGMKVADLDVTDADGAPHGLVVGGTNAAFFRIRNDDELWLVLQEGQLDYEATPTLTVQVEVSGAPAINTGAITVTVNNVNDNLPMIEQLGSQIPLLEGTFSVDTNTRYHYTASDADGGTSRLTLSGDPRERFQIDTNGNLQIKANSEFDYENPDDSSITLTITAADSGVGSGNQPINTTETVTIRLRNINDNPPVITQSGRQAPLDEGTFSSDTNTGYSYTVSDADTPRALLIPSVSGDPQNRFAIDASGNLQIKAGSEFNYESLDEGAITLTITATDSGVGPGSPAVTDTETVIITFGDVNEAPTATPRVGISTNDNLPYALQSADFGFSDVDANDSQFHWVIITSLPAQGQGTLELNGNPVSINTSITLTDINNGRLVYMPNEVPEGGQPYNAQIGYRVLDDGDGSGANSLSSDVATLAIRVGVNQSATAVSVIAQGRVTDIDENTDLTGGMKVADLDVTDTDGAPHRLTLSGDNAGLFAIRNEDELWLVEGATLDFEATRTLTVQVEVSGAPAINTGAITVRVNDVNEAPAATPRTGISTNDNLPYALQAADFGFSDVDADDSQLHSVIITSLPGQGTLELNGTSVSISTPITLTDINNGRLIYTPNEVQEGGQVYNAEIGYRVQDDGDGDGANSLSSDVATLAIRVGANQAATAVSVIAQGRVTDINENTDLTEGMKVADLDVTDTDGAPHRLTLSGINAGLFAIRNDDELWLVEGTTLDFEATRTLTVQVEVFGAPAINTGAITVRLNNVNDNPPIIEQLGSQIPLNEGTFPNTPTNTGYRYTASDADGGTSTLSVSGDPQNRFAIDASGNLQIKAGSKFNYESLDEGAITLTITATDSGVGAGAQTATDTETVTITFEDVNEAPTATPRAGISTNDHKAYTLEAVDFGFSDVDADDSQLHSVIITSLPGQGTLELNGTSVSINTPITLTDINNGHLIYMPSAVQAVGQPYNAEIGYRVVDDGDGGNGLSSDVATLAIRVGANQSATAVSVIAQGRVTDIDENTDLTGGVKVADLDVTDTDGAPHRLTLSGINAGLFAIRNEDELWLVEGPTLDFEATRTLTVQVEVSGAPAINTGAITVRLNNVNEAPTATPRAGISTNDHKAYTLEAVDFGFSDVDADDSQLHSVIITSLPAQGQGTLELNGNPVSINTPITLTDINNGHLIYTPNEVQEGGQPYNAEIGYRVVDDGDGAGGNGLSSDVATLAIRVGANQSATAVSVVAQGRVTDIDENTDLTGGMKVADLDVTDADGAPHRLTLSGANAGLFAIRNEDELWLVEGATLDFETTPTLTVQVEVSGAPAINTGAITVRVNDVNEAPAATPRTGISTTDNLPYALQAADFGFSDVDANDNEFHSVIITSLPGQGTLELNGTSVSINTSITLTDINNGRLIYMPMEQQEGGQPYNAQIGYRVLDDGDGSGANSLSSDVATLAIRVGANQSATAVSVIVQGRVTDINENTDLTGGMKVADLDVTDTDGAPHRLTLSGANAGLFAIRNEDELWLVLQEGQTLDYEFTPTLTVQVEVSGAPAINTGAITVRVNNVNDNPPIIEQLGSQIPLNEGTFPNTPTNTGYRYTASDADGGTSTLSVSGDPQNRFAIDASGNLQIKAGSKFNYESLDEGAITLIITATDSGVGAGTQTATDTETVTITFEDVNEAPTATPRAGLLTNDHRAYTLEAVDFGFRDVDADDIDDQFYSVIITSLPAQDQGTLALNGVSVSINTPITLTDINNGRLIYTPNEVPEGGQPYNAEIGYRVQDDGDGDGTNSLSSDAATLAIRVGANQSATAVSVIAQGRVTDIDENTDLTSGMKVADLDVTDTDGAPHRLTLSGINAGLFAIRNEDELWLVEGATLDFETTPTLTVQVEVFGAPAINTGAITVRLNNVNEAPTATPRVGISTNDNLPDALQVADFGFSDVDADDSQFHSVIITSLPGQGQGTLELNGNPVSINTPITFTDINNRRFVYTPNEVPEGGQPYNAQIGYRVQDDGDGDGTNSLSSGAATLAIRVVGVNQSATAVSVIAQGRVTDIDENTDLTGGMKVADLDVTDTDGAPHRLVLSGANAGLFAIRNDDELWLVEGATLDFEATRTLTVQVEVSGAPAINTGAITVAVNDVNEVPTATPRAGISTTDDTAYALEAMDFGFNDVDAGDSQFHSVIITSLPVQGQGTLELNGVSVSVGDEITFTDINNGRLVYTPNEVSQGQYNAAIGYRVQDDGDGAGGNGLRSDVATFVIGVVEANQSATAVAVIAQGRVTDIDENTDLTGGMKVADLDVTDTDGAPHRLVLGGDNAGLFAIRNEDELWLVEGATLDFEATRTLTVQVEVSDAPAINTGAITVRLNDVNEVPTAIPRAGISTNDDTAYALEAVDFGFSDVDAGDSQFHSVIITSLPGQGQGTLELNGTSVSINTPITFTDITNGQLIYMPSAVQEGGQPYNAQIGYRVLDDGDAGGVNKLSSATETLVIAVRGSVSATGVAVGTQHLTAIDENTDLTGGMKVADLTVTGADGGLDVGGVHAEFFEIRNDDELWLKMGAVIDYESTPVLTVQVEVSGAPAVSTNPIAVTVNNINDNTPVIERTGTQYSLLAGTFPADTPTNTRYRYTASDADGGTSVLRVSGDDRFQLDASGILQIKAGSTFDYQVRADRSITLTITAADSGIGSGNQPADATETVTITFRSITSRTVITPSGEQVPLDEGTFSNDTNTGYSFTVIGTDNPHPSQLILRVSGDALDRFQFDRDGNLQIKAGSSFDYETPEDRTINLGIAARHATEMVTITFSDISTEINIDSGDASFSIAIDGSLVTGAVLTATEITPDPDIDDAVYSYQWYHIGAGTDGADVDIAEATSKSYTIADTDEGKRTGVRVSYEEDSFQSDGRTPTGTEIITAELPIADFTEIRDISSEVIYDAELLNSNVDARISTEETSDRLILGEFGGNDRSVFDVTNPHRATEFSAESSYVYGISGVDKDHFMFVQNGSRISIVSKTGFNYENPTDSDQDNNYEFTLAPNIAGARPISYTLTIVDDISEVRVKTATASIIETSSSIKFTSLEDAVRAYSGIDDALLEVSATFGGAVMDGANPHRAMITFEVAGQADIVFAYELSGDDVSDVLLVQDGNDVSLITVAGLDHENPADKDGMSTYSVVETITTTSPNIPSAHRAVSTTYTLNVTNDPSEVSIEVYENHPLYKPLEIDSVDLQGYQLTQGYVDNALFTIDNSGQVRWKAIPDHEAPHDGDGDNLYEIELSRTNSIGQMDRVQVDIMVKDIGIDPPPEENYSARFFLSSDDIADEYLPSEFAQHLILGYAWKVPTTGPVIIQYSIDTDQIASFYNDNQLAISRFHSLLDAALLSSEQAANLKFIEVAHREDGDDVPYINIEVEHSSASSSRFFPNDRHATIIYGDVHVGGYTLYSYDAQHVIPHELGHALGLGHPFEESGTHFTGPGTAWPGDEDYLLSPLSVLSYNNDVVTFQPADIEALQFLYGAPGTNFMGVESIMAESRFASRLAVEAQDLNEIDENTNLAAGMKVADITVTDTDLGAFGTLEIVGDHAEFFEIRNGLELWLALQEGESLENIAALEVYVRIAEKHAVRTGDITITVNDASSSEAMGSSGLVGGATGDSGQIKIDEMVNEGQSVIANLIDLDLGEIDLTEITVGGGDKDQVQIRQTQDGGVLEFVSAPDFEAPEDDDEDNVYEITLYDDLTSIEVDVTVIDIPEL